MRPGGRPKGLGLQSLILQDWNIPPPFCGVVWGGIFPPPSCGGGGGFIWGINTLTQLSVYPD